MPKIDAHIHLIPDHPESIKLIEEFDLKLLNINVDYTKKCFPTEGKWWREHVWRDHAKYYRELMQKFPERFSWCTTFDLPDFGNPKYIDHVIQGLEQDFADGAIACKVWKNIGMEIKDPQGRFLMVDDPFLEPIFRYIEQKGKTLLMHIGEPLACWRPLVENTPHYGYYSKNPEWHMYGKPNFPSHEELIAARDHIAARHPKLKVIGAHLGSLEYDVAELAKCFERYPNFAVDTSGRINDLAFQERDKVREFMIQYQDRILYGSDIVREMPHSVMSETERAQAHRWIRKMTETAFTYYNTDQAIEVFDRKVPGLKLPEKVLDQLFFANAKRWYPGI